MKNLPKMQIYNEIIITYLRYYLEWYFIFSFANPSAGETQGDYDRWCSYYGSIDNSGRR